MSEAVSLAFAFAWLMAAPAVQSQDVSPDVLMKSPSAEVVAEIRKDKAVQAGNTAKSAALVDAKAPKSR
jgi:polygalacturonase